MKSNRRSLFAANCLLLVPLLLAGESSAGTPAALPEEKSAVMAWLEGDYMFGDWNGLRTDLAKRGVDFELFYFGSAPSNLDGGIKTGTVYQGAMLATLGLRSEELLGYEGGDVFVSATWLNGTEKFSDNYIGDLNKVNLTDFSNDFRLWELWYSQELMSKKLKFKAGVMSVDRDFIVPEYYNSIGSINFLNQTFFFPTLAFNLYEIPGFPVGNHSLPSTPFGALGMLARYEPIDNLYVQAAVYDGNPDATNHGTQIKLNGDEGALIYCETGFSWNPVSSPDGLPGVVKVGGFYHTDAYYDVGEGTAYVVANAFGAPSNLPSDHDGNYGAYLLAEQYLWLESGKSDPAMQGALAFFRLSAAPGDRNLTTFGIDGGLVFKGLVPNRDWDTLGLGFSYLEISDDISNAVRTVNSTYLTGFKIPDYEGLIELSYKAQMTAWWTVQPSLQWVLHPGGYTNLINQPSDAIAFVLQSTLRF